MLITKKKIQEPVHMVDFIHGHIKNEIDIKYNKYSVENIKKLREEYTILVLYKYFLLKYDEKGDIQKYIMPLLDFPHEFIKENIKEILYYINEDTISALINTYYKKLNHNAIYIISSYTPNRKSYIMPEILEFLSSLEEVNVSKKYININHIVELSKTKLFYNEEFHIEYIKLLKTFVKKYMKIRGILISYINSSDYMIRVEAIDALSKLIMKPRIKIIIESKLDDRIRDVREKAKEVLLQNKK